MKYVEYGKDNKDVIILLHGGGLSWWNYRKIAIKLTDKYHIILPVLDGHSNSDKDFSTIEDNAKEVIDFIDKYYSGSVLLIGGLSLGAQIVLDILSQRKDICKYALIESALVLSSQFTYKLIEPSIKSSYGLIKYRWFSKLQFKSLKIKDELFEDYYRDTSQITKQNMIVFLKANQSYAIKPTLKDTLTKVYIYVGEKENHVMHKSAKLIHKKIDGSSLQVLSKMYHGEFSINHPDDYVNTILNILKD